MPVAMLAFAWPALLRYVEYSSDRPSAAMTETKVFPQDEQAATG
jgi:hypothetical protein